MFFCSTTVAGNDLVNNARYPRIVADYEHSFSALRRIPCDVFLAPHPGMFHMDEKRQRLGNASVNPFVDPRELQRFVNESEYDFHRQLTQQ